MIFLLQLSFKRDFLWLCPKSRWVIINQPSFISYIHHYPHMFKENTPFFVGSLQKLLINPDSFSSGPRSLHDAWVPGKFVLAFNGVLSNTSPLDPLERSGGECDARAWYILVGGLEHDFYFPIQLGMSSSQLTLIFFRGVGIPPASYEFSFN